MVNCRGVVKGPDPSRRNYRELCFMPTVIKWVCSTNGLRRISQHLILLFCMRACINPPPGFSTGFHSDVQQSPAFSLTQLGSSVQSRVTKPTNTKYTPITWENPEVCFVQNPTIGQLSQQTPHTESFNETALQQQRSCQQFLPNINLFNPCAY